MNELTFKQILVKLFNKPNRPSINLVGSYEGGNTSPWKTGKTDIALLISEILLKMKLVKKVATNIETFGHYKYIEDLDTLIYWLKKDKEPKLFIFDELNAQLNSRRSMTNKTVSILEVFPEISKSRSKLLGVAQKISILDNQLRGFGWVSGMFLKVNLKTVYVVSPQLNGKYLFNNIPPTTITFDPYLHAPFRLHPIEGVKGYDDEDLRLLDLWSNGKITWRHERFGHQMKLNRWLKKQVKLLLSVTHSHNQAVEGKGGQIVTKT